MKRHGHSDVRAAELWTSRTTFLDGDDLRRTDGEPLSNSFTGHNYTQNDQKRLTGKVVHTGCRAGGSGGLNASGMVEPTGGWYRVVFQRVAVRDAASTGGSILDVLHLGHFVRVQQVEEHRGQPWARLADEELSMMQAASNEAWVLVDGATIGLGKLLEPAEHPQPELPALAHRVYYDAVRNCGAEKALKPHRVIYGEEEEKKEGETGGGKTGKLGRYICRWRPRETRTSAGSVGWHAHPSSEMGKVAAPRILAGGKVAKPPPVPPRPRLATASLVRGVTPQIVQDFVRCECARSAAAEAFGLWDEFTPIPLVWQIILLLASRRCYCSLTTQIGVGTPRRSRRRAR